MRNPHGNLICGEPHYITGSDGKQSGPWGVICGYWRCTDDRCCIRDGDPERFPMEASSAPCNPSPNHS